MNKPVSTIIVIIIITILIFLFVIPKYQESRDLQTKLYEKQATYNGESAYYAKLSELVKDIESRKDVLEKIDSALPPDTSFAPLLYFLQKKGDESGLVVKSVTFSQALQGPYGQVLQESSDKKIKNVMFTLNLSGNYQGLKKFLASLEKSARLFQVDDISFLSQEPLRGTTQLQSKLQVYDFKLDVKTQTY